MSIVQQAGIPVGVPAVGMYPSANLQVPQLAPQRAAPPPRARQPAVSAVQSVQLSWVSDNASAGNPTSAGLRPTLSGVPVASMGQSRTISPGGPPRAASVAMLHQGQSSSGQVQQSPQQQRTVETQQASANPQRQPIIGNTNLKQPTMQAPMAGGGPPPGPMTDGEVITVGRRQFVVNEMVGEGAYARVWGARELDSGMDVAIKEMRCGQGPGILPDASLQRAMFEVQVMQRLMSDAEDGDRGANTVGPRPSMSAPRIIDHQFWPLGPSAPKAYICRVAMTRRPGRPLGTWLDSRTQRRAPQGNGKVDEIERFNALFLESACAARSMIAQLAPTFERLNGSIAYHRDVNARNLLVYCPLEDGPEDQNGCMPPDASGLEFTVLDFGSSTEARAWLGTGEGSWQVENPTGDARYWGPASWVRFLGGPQALSAEASLLRQYTRRLDIFALAVCTLELLVKLHTVDFPSESSFRSLPESRALEGQIAQSIIRVHGSWVAYWTVAVSSFDRLAEYSRLSCMGDQAAAMQVWQSLCAGQIPETLSHKLHELCSDLHYLSEICRSQRGGSASGSWQQVSSTLSALLDMVHFNGSLEWSELVQRVGSAPQRRAPQRREPLSVSATAGVVSQMDSAASVLQTNVPSAASHGNSLSVPTAGSPYGSPYGAQEMSPTQDRSPLNALRRVNGDALVTSSALNADVSPSALTGLGMPTTTTPTMGVQVLVETKVESPTQFSSDAALLKTSETAVLSPSQADFQASAAAVTYSTGLLSSSSALASVGGFDTEDRGHNFGVVDSTRQLPEGHSQPSVHANPQTPPFGLPQSSGTGGTFEHSEEREHEALRILRQVESEVRTLKRWYTEAIEAMRSPNPFPPSEGI